MPPGQGGGLPRYTKSDPVFITTLESNITELRGKKIEAGDVKMMLKRLDIYKFSHAIDKADITIKPCGCCFGKLLLDPTECLWAQCSPCSGAASSGTDPSPAPSRAAGAEGGGGGAGTEARRGGRGGVALCGKRPAAQRRGAHRARALRPGRVR